MFVSWVGFHAYSCRKSYAFSGGAQQAGGGSHQDSGAALDIDGLGRAQLQANLRLMMLSREHDGRNEARGLVASNK